MAHTPLCGPPVEVALSCDRPTEDSPVVETWELIKSQRNGAINANLSLSQ